MNIIDQSQIDFGVKFYIIGIFELCPRKNDGTSVGVDTAFSLIHNYIDLTDIQWLVVRKIIWPMFGGGARKNSDSDSSVVRRGILCFCRDGDQ